MRGPTDSSTVSVGRLAQLAQRRRREGELLEDAVGLARLEAQLLRVLVHAEVDVDLVEVGQLGIDVAGVAQRW